MKLLGWTIVVSGLLVGIAACTVETTDSTSDGGTGGTGGGAAGAGGTAGSAAGAAGSVAGAAGSVAGAGGEAGAAGAASCTVEDPDAANACDLCSAEKCCAEWLECEDDVATPPAINTSCLDVFKCAAACDAGDLVTCLQDCDPDANPKVSAFYNCVYTEKCATECQ